MPKAIILNLFIILLSLSSYANSTPSNENKINIEAKQLTILRDKKIVLAKGDAKVTQLENIVSADHITIDSNKKTYHAIGNVYYYNIQKPSELIYANEAVFQSDRYHGVSLDVAAVFGRSSSMVAKNVEIVDKDHIILNDVKYTACPICETNFNPNKPNWEFHAKQAELDKESDRIYFKNVKFRMFDIPLLYSPYFSAPAPGAKRKSGFLRPKATFSSNNLGHTIALPYYFNIAPNFDVTYTPKVSSLVGLINEAEIRHLMPKGNYIYKIRATYAPKFDMNGYRVYKKRVLIGSHNFSGDYSINHHYVSLNSKAMFDHLKTFNQKYDYEDEQVLQSDLYYRYIQNDSYISIRPILFQELRPHYLQATTPMLLPILEANKSFKVANHNASVLINFANIHRRQGNNYRRFSTDFILEKQIQYNNKISLEYYANNAIDLFNNHYVKVKDESTQYYKWANSDDNFGRMYTSNHRKNTTYNKAYRRHTFFTKIKYSQYLVNGDLIAVLEPTIMPVLSLQSKRMRLVPNEDSQDPEISSSNIFDINRFRGFDKIEDGARINYGINGSLSTDNIRSLDFTLGQVYKKEVDKRFSKLSGMNKRFSDFVLSADLTLTKYLTIHHDSRLHSHNFNIMRTNNGFNIRIDDHKFEILHSYSDKIFQIHPNDFMSELNIKSTLNLHNNWTLHLNQVIPFSPQNQTKANKPINYGINLVYNSSCLKFLIGVDRSFVSNKDVKPSITPKIEFAIIDF